jgi:FAD:protein FMN transferase
MTSSFANVRRARPLLGTYVEVAASGANQVHLHAAIDRAFFAVETVHNLMSFQDPGSELSRLNRQGGGREGARIMAGLHPWTAQVLAAAAEFRERSHGVFDAGASISAVSPKGLPSIARSRRCARPASDRVSSMPVAILPCSAMTPGKLPCAIPPIGRGSLPP